MTGTATTTPINSGTTPSPEPIDAFDTDPVTIEDLSSSSSSSPSRHHLKRNPVSATSVADFDKNNGTNDDDDDESGFLPCKNVAPLGPFEGDGRYTNTASAVSGARILFATDDWFATAETLLSDGPPVFDPDAFCEQGKVLDGWETRRRRQAGHDWCLIKLSQRTEVSALEIDTAHFTGNNVPSISLEICDTDAEGLSEMVSGLPGALDRLLHGGVQGTGRFPEEVAAAEDAVNNKNNNKRIEWKELLPKTPLSPGFESTRMHYLKLDTPLVGTIVRVNYFPDGGVARLKCWGRGLGEPKPATTPLYMPIKTCGACTVVAHSSVSDPSELPSRTPCGYPEVSSLEHGGTGGTCSNKHYGEPWRLIQANLGRDMGDGWETARHPDRPGILVAKKGSELLDTALSDWAVLELGRVAEGGVARIIIDTKHFRGNFPESVAVEARCCGDNNGDWFPLVPRSKTSPDAEHVYERSKGQLENADRAVTHVRVTIFPDGGISRVRIYG